MKKQNGITLVALVITIIVLLILAGVSISLALGQNGVLTRASGAVSANERAKVVEELGMAVNEAQTVYYTNKIGAATYRKSIPYYLTSTTGTATVTTNPEVFKNNCMGCVSTGVVLDTANPTGTKVTKPTYDETNKKWPTAAVDSGIIVGYYQSNGSMIGSIIPYYNDAACLRKVIYIDRFEELNKYYNTIIVIDSKLENQILDDYQMLIQSMYLTKFVAEKKAKDLSKVDYSPIVKKLYKYNGKI